MLIYSSKITKRVKYTFEHVFKNMWNLEFSITEKAEAFKLSNEEKLNYSSEDLPGPQINPSGLLFQNNISPVDPDFKTINTIPIIFPTEGELGFDPFSAIFFMISRYEEYLPHPVDEEDRFSGKDSFAFRNGFLHLPVVNIWVNQLKLWLTSKYPQLQFRQSTFTALLSYDIDVAYAFKGRSFYRNFLGISRDLVTLKIKNLIGRLNTLINDKDPWDVYPQLLEQIRINNLNAVFFFLLGNNSAKDKNLSYKNILLRKLILEVEKHASVAIHPSYKSYLNPEKIIEEKSRLELIIAKSVLKSRQHFLRIRFPQTYQYLIQAGITQDYTLGFADLPGFRAGICTPFYFYDISIEMQTDLEIFPVTVMEGTLMKYQKLTSTEAILQIERLIEEVYNVDGIFIPLWHNQTLSNQGAFKGWNEIHNKMITKFIEVQSR